MLKRIILGVILILIAFPVYGLIRGIKDSTTVYAQVVDKDVNPYRVFLKVVSEDINSAQEVEIIIKDKNLWNLIEKDRTYQVTYTWKGHDSPILRNIELGDGHNNN